jgi:hypothetical protein
MRSATLTAFATAALLVLGGGGPAASAESFETHPAIALRQATSTTSASVSLSPASGASVVKERRSNGVLLEQVATGRLMLFSKSLSVTLEVQEQPQTLIVFQDVLHTDFERYEGSWSLVERAGQVQVTYRLRASMRAPLPALLTQGAFRVAAGDLLSQVRAEIQRRARAVQP